MKLTAGDWGLSAGAALKIIIPSEQPGAEVKIEIQLWVHRSGNTKLRFERPTIGAEIDQFRRIVLAQRSHNDDAGADNSFLTIGAELFQIHRRCGPKIDGEAKARIT